MNILISCNDQYTMPVMVMLTSLFSAGCSPEKDPCTIYMLESELSDAANNRIEKLVTQYGGVYVRIHLSEDLFALSKTRSHISKETYYRLLAAQYLPAQLDRILWLDADLIVRSGIRAFYETPFDGSMAVACGYGPAMQELIRGNAVSLGLKSPETYFNAGVMLMDLDACRERISEDSLLRLSAQENTAGLLFPGQDVVNLIFDGCVKLADYRLYNCMTHCIVSGEDLAFAKERAKIVHFPGAAKPWKFHDIPFADEWMEWYAQCFGDPSKLRRMSYFRLKELYEKQGKAKQ